MALARYKPSMAQAPLPEPIKAVPEPFKGIVQNNTYTSNASILGYVEGSSWSVNYYRQLINEHNDLKSLDVGQDPLYQQYEKIIGLEIRVSSPLSSSGQDHETGYISVNGSGLIYPYMIPNEKDMFIADIGDGRDGIFAITEVNRSGFNKDSVFTIEYSLIDFIQENDTKYNDLESKSARTVYFDKDSLVTNNRPFLIEDQYRFIKELDIHYKELVSFYFKTFFSTDTSTLILPGQKISSIYDPYVVDFILRIIDTFDAPEIRKVKKLVVMDDAYLKQDQIYSMMLQRDISLLPLLNKEMGVTSSNNFNSNPYLQGIKYSGIDYIIYPSDVDNSVSGSFDSMQKFLSQTSIQQVTSIKGMFNANDDVYTEGVEIIPYIKSIDIDKYYVLSESFYKNGENKSMLEILVRTYLKGEALDYKKLWSLIKRWKSWGRLEQFYYIPLIITLIKASKRER